MQKKDGKWFTRKKGAMLVLTLCLVGAAGYQIVTVVNGSLCSKSGTLLPEFMLK